MKSWIVDIGNSTLKCADPFPEPGGGNVHRFESTPDGVRHLVGMASAAGVERLWIASVVPVLSGILADALARTGITGVWVTHRTAGLLAHRLDNPEGVGIDRLLAARAAWALYGMEGVGVIVVQAGSAVTVDPVSTEGVFLGGCILPGPGLWLHGLQQAGNLGSLGTAFPHAPKADVPIQPRTSGASLDMTLSQAREAILADAFPGSPDSGETHTAPGYGKTAGIEPPSGVYGAQTRAAIALGLRIGWRGAVDAVVRAQRGDGASRIVLTGGWSDALRDSLPNGTILHPDLVLEGLRLLWDADSTAVDG